MLRAFASYWLVLLPSLALVAIIFGGSPPALLVAAYLTHTVVAQLSLGLATPRPVELDPAVASELVVQSQIALGDSRWIGIVVSPTRYAGIASGPNQNPPTTAPPSMAPARVACWSWARPYSLVALGPALVCFLSWTNGGSDSGPLVAMFLVCFVQMLLTTRGTVLDAGLLSTAAKGLWEPHRGDPRSLVLSRTQWSVVLAGPKRSKVVLRLQSSWGRSELTMTFVEAWMKKLLEAEPETSRDSRDGGRESQPPTIARTQ